MHKTTRCRTKVLLVSQRGCPCPFFRIYSAELSTSGAQRGASKSRQVEHGERFLQKEMEKISGLCSDVYVLNNQDPSGAKKWVTHITKRMATMSLEEEKQQKRRRTAPAQPYPTWAQIKNLTRKAEDVLKETRTPLTPDKLFLGMLAVLSCTSALSANYTYWTYIPAPPLLQFVDWSEPSPLVFTNDSQHFPPPWSRAGPTHPDQEGKAINISIGYKVLPICFGASPPCMSILPQWWGYSYNNGTGFRLGFFAATSFLLNQSERYYHGQIFNSTKALFLPEEPPSEAVSWQRKHQGPPLFWSECRGVVRKISHYLNVTFIDWGLHGMFVNCSD
ncbi:endogenous retrovirus group K member 113 Env polyprotein-like [Cervus elaphus]|uniref:endogenous retrovirus group K member 113 Env polyprotein-like n=1 Tax=Cervus canadensis TaxID=1574408 RepID=UPI001CA320CE|nr:endogenous retrovirus group K member 113 Env polyprotein-like [Cervus canadensis]XP_043752291.1 endogenous retrovirus group K member 113 Env polyprotein-like [Cervus elaphus]